ncbi:phosphocarrier protein HPr [Rhodovibrio sodomensis]|uniref:Phosphocarrier protein HPr n=1 Tax=Rhodovibrio sodomensis TaxID=1088 RepID=A0ABS1DMC7_9PROT|nr:HPr family phosphocarrier protein [Rhodovibrio sodomensis]MBK1670638.1 phosphocarrier protein HPr [Rhodovibrio sodomensis]
MAVAEGAQELTHAIGLHARPAVKLTQLASRFESNVRLRVGADGDWINAKSVSKVMRLKARTGKTLHFRAEGDDADEAVAALKGLVERGFGDDTQ